MDYRNFITGDNPVAKGYWWQQEDEKATADYLWSAAQAVFEDDVQRRNRNLLYARLYSDDDFSALDARGHSRGITASVDNQGNAVLASRIAFNVVAACVDTLMAKVFKNKPRPLFLTSGAGWVYQRKAKALMLAVRAEAARRRPGRRPTRPSRRARARSLGSWRCAVRPYRARG